ncbi:Pectinesterase inhibitor [Corchorus capsularis]|uniref:Pectinesterase inhibitor n=1 Tax=Corchorus capsularis TaxID=210143 RepID=A0A1R3ITD9_COCAP|nr:Pectinesterase inhibitor [Corchorus capsularis]
MAAKTSLLFLSLSLLYIASHAGRSPVAASSRATNFIKSKCSATTYPALCFQSLAAFAPSIQQSPRQLAQTALSVSLARAQSAQGFVAKMKKFKGLKKREYEAIKDCIEEMGDSVDRLSKSVQELKRMGQAKGQDFIWHLSNVDTWVSAALTDENTCLDGFAGRALDGKIKSSIRARILNVAQVTSNALSLVNQFASKQ